MTLTPVPPPAALAAAVSARLNPAPRGDWHALSGGRTNRLWQVACGSDMVVVKLYRPEGETPLFPNDPVAEYAALTALAPAGLAPVPRALLRGSFGAAAIYRYLDAVTAGPDPAGLARRLARLLGRVHASPLIAPLRDVPSGTEALLRQTDALAAQLPAGLPDRAADLRRSLDRLETVAPSEPRFLHTDPVGANVVVTRSGPVLIDWQCPGRGDPCEDLAIVLSPSMRLAYDGGLRDEDIPAFLEAYPDPRLVRRYRALAPVYHLRMAVYALWCEAHGRGGGSLPAKLELDAAEAAVSAVRRE
jgi:aminoglycoside phosphotransferase (APT) family kinase protein